MPLSAEVRGLPVLDVTVRAPDRIPDTVGEKLTLMKQLALGARLVVQVFVWAKSPVIAIATLVTVVVVLLVSVAVCILLTEPTAWLPNWSVAGLSVSVPPASCDSPSWGASRRQM
jgi:hypothetical protein